MANYKIETIEGIGSAFGQKLREAGIKTTDELLKATKTKKQRKELAGATGINEDKILTWANHVDLFRIQGVGAQYAELLEATGVDTVKELANRNAENLVQKMEEVNNSKKLVRRIPPLKSVQKWIETAKALPRGLEYWFSNVAHIAYRWGWQSQSPVGDEQIDLATLVVAQWLLCD